MRYGRDAAEEFSEVSLSLAGNRLGRISRAKGAYVSCF